MVMHARSGGNIEIMGLMQGYISGPTIVVTDAFRLPVEGTETRVNAQSEANEYMVQFLQRARDVGQLENAVGWYHSHPGYGCWLSGVDVNTQMQQQMYSDPFAAVVIDPDRTISAGKVEIGAFRTYPEGYTPESSGSAGDETIPVEKMKDFGAYADKYYSMEVSHFKSSLDTKLLEALWNKYWVSTLSSSPLFTNHEYGTKQMADMAQKMRLARDKVNSPSSDFASSRSDGAGNGHLDKLVKAGHKIVAEEESGLLAVQIKEKLFGGFGVAKAKEDEEMKA
jgi:COP9 signalosome complex subunit 5